MSYLLYCCVFSSIRHRWTGRFEAHLWDNSSKKEGQTRKGRQVYLGGYDMEEKAGRSYDLAALKYWGPSTHINFPLQNYRQELEDIKNMTRQEFVAHLRRKSSGFSRGTSMYRGVTSIISMEDGKLGLAELPETRIFILAHSGLPMPPKRLAQSSLQPSHEAMVVLNGDLHDNAETQHSQPLDVDIEASREAAPQSSVEGSPACIGNFFGADHLRGTNKVDAFLL